MADIGASVGKEGKNNEPDVEEVQTLLDVVPVSAGGANPPIDIDGWCGNKTQAAILNFQRVQKFAVQDGRVDPGKTTIKRLNELAQGPGTRTVAPPDMDPAQLALQSVMQASIWANSGLASIRAAKNNVSSTGSLAGLDTITVAALSGHFKLTNTLGKVRLLALLDVVERNYVAALGVLSRAPSVFVSVSRKRMSIDFGGGEGAPGYVLPANRSRVNWTPLFRINTTGARPGRDWTGNGWGRKCRAAMVLHEPLHMVDARGGLDIYEHSPQYRTMTADQAVHNAASYPSFGAHVDERSTEPLGPLYGAGRPND
jgi:hypothetical protein